MLFNGGEIATQAESAVVCELKRIIKQEALMPFYQPIFRLEPFGVLGVEALSRPQTDTMLMNPEMLFKAALQYGFL